MEIIAQHGPTLIIIALIFGLFMAWGIGANDVANALGTSVGSGAITVKTAIICLRVATTFYRLCRSMVVGGVVERRCRVLNCKSRQNGVVVPHPHPNTGRNYARIRALRENTLCANNIYFKLVWVSKLRNVICSFSINIMIDVF